MHCRSSHQRCSIKKGVLRNFTKFTGKHLCQGHFFKRDSFKKEALTQVFSCEFCEISRNTFFTEHLWTTVSCTAKIFEEYPRKSDKHAGSSEGLRLWRGRVHERHL